MRPILLLIVIPFCFYGQDSLPSFRSSENAYYWKNRKPYEGYWQQDVHYKIQATLNDPANIIEGSETLTYYNNSPDTLSVAYFHLYNNAQVKGSYLADLYQQNGFQSFFGPYRTAGLGTSVESLMSAGKDLKTELDNTVLKVWLPRSLKPGDSVVFQIKFKTYFDFDAIRNRMRLFPAFGFKHFNLVHWYPRISVYDARQGWDTDQHMDHEFYGDFGTFEVDLTLPNYYICDGTGKMINRHEMLPEELRKKLDIANFAKKPWNEAPSDIIHPDGTVKTWKFRAINVHDAAYTFDPTYRIGEVYSKNHTHCIALVQEPHASRWQNAAAYVSKIVNLNSANIGNYAYPKMISADAQDGMEYPMMTLNGGADPSYRGLFIHELSHNWFFGMVGSNETYRAFLDEGFTQFFTCDGWEKMEGLYDLYPKIKNKYILNHTDSVMYRERAAYGGYFGPALRGDETSMNEHSDYYNGAVRHGGGYGQVYTKTAVMLYNLRYVLGDSLFYKGIKGYFNQWRFCHPYPEDLRRSFVHFTGVDLNWFFDEWIESSTKTLDYKIRGVKDLGGSQFKITFERKGRMQMPIDFTIFTKDKRSFDYYIPNNWFIKPTQAKVLPRWIGWDRVKTKYEAVVQLPEGAKISKVEIDTAHIMPDTWPVDNAIPRNITWFDWDSKVNNPPNRNKYQTLFRPSLWYNGYDGAKVGFNTSGNYMNFKNIFSLSVWLNTGLGQAYLDSGVSINSHDFVSFLFNFATPLQKISPRASVYSTIKHLDGLSSGLLGFDIKNKSERTRYYVQFKGMLRDVGYDMNYLIYKNQWTTGMVNSYAAAGLDHNYEYKRGTGFINFHLRAPFFGDYDYSSLTGTAINKTYFGKVGIHTRAFAQYGSGSRVPFESMLFVAGANPEEMMDNQYTRSMGIFQPFAFGAATNNFCYGGGLNLRGYMGYLLPQTVGNTGNIQYTYKGTSGASCSMEIDFGKMFGFISKATKQSIAFSPYLFADAGTIQTSYYGQALAFSDIMADAGVGAAVSILRWWKLSHIKPLTVRVDFPLFINRLPYVENNYFQFRWMLGVSRAF